MPRVEHHSQVASIGSIGVSEILKFTDISSRNDLREYMNKFCVKIGENRTHFAFISDFRQFSRQDARSSTVQEIV